MYNKIVLIGNVVKDPESRSVKGTSVTKFRLAVDDQYKKDSVMYIDVEAWDKQSEFCEKWLKKGKGVIVDGRLCMDTWEKDGQKRSKLYVIVDRMQLIGARGEGKGTPSSARPQNNGARFSNSDQGSQNEMHVSEVGDDVFVEEDMPF
jgi:single-strand DNA-binding protein